MKDTFVKNKDKNNNNNNKDIDIQSEQFVRHEDDKKCAPGITFEHGSCIRLNILIEMANAYNADSGNSNKIKLYPSFDTLNPGKYKKYLLNEFTKRLTKCHTQKCWTREAFIENLSEKSKKELQTKTYRPDGPQGKFTWLNTINIKEEMEQYQEKYKDFRFMGAVPIDFDDLPALGIRDMNLDMLKKNNIYRLGFIFNLDEHYKKGSHWVALFADLNKKQVYFFDSYGSRPDRRIRVLMRRIAKYMLDDSKNTKNTDVTVDYNKIRHQYKNSECGVYSINFILRMLRGDDFETICKDKVPDDEINKCRKVYYTDPKA